MSIFTTEHAARLMNKMKAFYGKKYAEQWGDIPAADIADAMVECLQGLSQEDFKRGYIEVQEGKCYHLCIFPGGSLRVAVAWA